MAVVGFSAESIVLGDTNFLNPPATTTTAGVVYLASDSDIEEGTSISKVVTAKALKNALDSIEFQATIQDVDLNSCKTPGVYHCKGQIQNIPPGYEQGTLFVTRNADGMVLQQYWTQTRKMWMRQLEGSGATEWKRYGNNFTASTTDLTAGSSPLENGCFYFVYE